jgi:type I restriction enzyme S subunit
MADQQETLETIINKTLTQKQLIEIYKILEEKVKSKTNKQERVNIIHNQLDTITPEQDIKIRAVIKGRPNNIDINAIKAPKPKKAKRVAKKKSSEKVEESKDSDGSEESDESDESKKQEFVFDEKITSSDALRDKIHSIHDFLRNNGIGYGMNALKIFSLLYGLRKIEHTISFNKIELDENCKFSELVKLAKLDNEDCFVLFKKDYMRYIIKSKLKSYLLAKIPDHIKAKDFNHLILEIDLLANAESAMNMNLSGKIYEYFIGRDESAISELGAYFTNRLITDYIYNLVNPQLEDDKVQSMIDPFGGSGGFTLGYISHLMKHNDIDWKENLENVNHIDMNNDVVKYTGLEFMCMTGEIPITGTHLRCENSFKYDFVDTKPETNESDDSKPEINNSEDSKHDTYKQYKYIFTNPPYGGDKNRRYGNRLKNWEIITHLKELISPINEKIYINKNKDKKKHVKITDDDLSNHKIWNTQLSHCIFNEKHHVKKFNKTKVALENSSKFIKDYAHKYGLKGNDKESVSFILIMALLAPGGTAVGVLKEGVFFNSTYGKLREHLIMNFNVLKVISIPQDQFENTSTKTSIVIFKKPIIEHVKGVPETTEIEFRKLNVLKYESNKFVFDKETNLWELPQISDDVFGMDDPIIGTATFDELKKKAWCLDGKKYNVKVLKPGKGFKMVKLGDIAEIKYGTRIVKPKNKDKKEGNIIPVYGGGNITFYTNKSNRNNGTLVVSRYALSKECIRIIRGDFYLNDSGMSLHVKNTYNQNYLNYFMINKKTQAKLLKDYTRGSIQNNVDLNAFRTIQIPVPNDPEVMQHWVDKISAPYNLKNERELQLKQLEQEVLDEVKRITDEEDCEEHKLGYIATINMGNTPSTKNSSYWYNGCIPWVTVAELNNNIIYETKKCLTEKGALSMKSRLIPRNSILLSFKLSIGKIAIAGLNMYCNEAIMYINPNHKYVNHQYLYKLLQITDLKKYGRGTIGLHGNLNKEILINLKIKIPKDKKFIDDLETKFQLIEQYKQDIKTTDEQFQKFINELGEASIHK